VKPHSIALLFVILLSGCGTYMHVSTEVYVGQKPPDELPASVAERASIARNALQGYEERVRKVGSKSYGALIKKLTTEYPLIFGDTSSIPEYEKSLREPLEEAIRPAHEMAEQVRLFSEQLGAPSTKQTPVFKETANLEEGLLQLRSLLEQTGKAGQEGLRALTTAEANLYRDAVRKTYLTPVEIRAKDGKVTKTFPNDKELAEKSGNKIDSANARKAAVDELIKNIHDVQIAGDADIERALLSPALDAARIIVTTTVVPLNDPAVPLLMTAPDTDWKKAVNDVESRNWFGNSEMAFRMDNLGDSHIKGILFDPSQAMKTGFNVLTKSLEITAAAYGANFGAVKSTTTTTTGDTSPGSTTVPTSTPPAPSKPAIDAELARNALKATARGEAMESLFRRLAEIGKALPAADADGASGAAKKVLALVNCTKEELADPTGRQCGGE